MTLPLLTAVIHHLKGPHINWAALSPTIVLSVGALFVLMLGLLSSAMVRERLVPSAAMITLVAAVATEVSRFGHPATIVHGAMRVDDLALIIDFICAVSAIGTVLLAWRSEAPRTAGQGEFYSLLLFSVMGMAILASAQDIITLFVGLELLSIPLYILCAAEYRREGSLESGLKYLIIGSVGSATLVYGLAMIYGASGQTGFDGISNAISSNNLLTDPLLLGGIALTAVGFAFKASVAPFHQWTPDVYEGAPTPVTAFMATATKAAALAIFLRFFDVALISDQTKWAPLLAALAAITIIVGNVGALGQTSLKRMLGFSGVAQAGYMLSGVIVGTRLGVSATVLYLLAYLMMNIAAFAVIHAQQTETGDDRVAGLRGLGKRSPVLAASLTVAMLGLAGIPGTVGFVGKFQLIHALVDGGYGWLAIVLVVGAMISLGYYLRVVAAVWMSPVGVQSEISGVPVPAGISGGGAAAGLAPIAGGSPEADKLPYTEVVLVAAVFGTLCIVFGILPSPLFHLASHAGAAFSGLF
jgi:NADH-quinone oxidoreductase subunit N